MLIVLSIEIHGCTVTVNFEALLCKVATVGPCGVQKMTENSLNYCITWFKSHDQVLYHIFSHINLFHVRVYPDVTLKTLRGQLGSLLGAERNMDKFSFLKCVGRSLALVGAAAHSPRLLGSLFFFFLCIASILSDSRGTMVWLTGSPFKQQRVKVWVKRGKHAFFSCHASFILQVKSKQESDLKVKTFAPPYVGGLIFFFFLNPIVNHVNIVF